MSVVSSNKAGLALQSLSDRPDRVPLKKGEYSVASRALAVSTYFLSGALAINLSQFIGSPLYLVNEDWYNAWIAFTKQSFGLLTMSLTQAFAPTKVIVSGDASVRGQLLKSTDGNLILDFPSRLILIANHQIYTDWLYLWWMAYCNGMHGRLYIILKESLKKIPVLGWGMQMSQFIFLKRNWEKDRPHMASALQKLNKATEPMWLLLFPEGTNLAPSTREKSKAWASKTGITDMQHVLLPRSTGLQFCIEELKGSVQYLYDCTVAYEGVPRGQYAQDIFTLKAGYLEGRPPKSVSMHWRRFAVKDIPQNPKAFELWLTARWREKDILIETYLRTGKFPADTGITKMKSGETKRGSGHLEVQIRSSHWYEFLQIFAPMGALAMVLAVFYGAIPQRLWKTFNKQALKSSTEDIKKAGAQAGSQAKAVSTTAAGLTLDDFFDQDKQEDSFKKGALAVQQFLQTPQAGKLMNQVDFVTSFLQNPQKAVTETVTGQRKNFMKSIKEEEERRKKLGPKNVGPQQGKFWKDLERLEKGRNGSTPSKSTGTKKAVLSDGDTFWDKMKTEENIRYGTVNTVSSNGSKYKGGLELGARGTFWDQVKNEQNSRYGTVMTVSSDASTAVGSVHTISSSASSRKPPSTVSKRGALPSTKPASKPAKWQQASKPQTIKAANKQHTAVKSAQSTPNQKSSISTPPKIKSQATNKPTAVPPGTKPKAVTKPISTTKPPSLDKPKLGPSPAAAKSSMSTQAAQKPATDPAPKPAVKKTTTQVNPRVPPKPNKPAPAVNTKPPKLGAITENGKKTIA